MVESRKLKNWLVAKKEKNLPNIVVVFIDKRGQNDVERKFRFSFDVVYNLFINKFDKNIWLVFLDSKFAIFKFTRFDHRKLGLMIQQLTLHMI